MAKFLDTTDDMQWLAEIHTPIAIGYACAILYGNEDAPSRLELFARNHYECRPTVLEPDADGKLAVTSEGNKPL